MYVGGTGDHLDLLTARVSVRVPPNRRRPNPEPQSMMIGRNLQKHIRFGGRFI